MKRKHTAMIAVLLSVLLLTPLTVSAKTPEIMSSLRSYIRTYGNLGSSSAYGNDRYTSRISYQKKKNRFLFECTYTNGRSTSRVWMYMPASKKKTNYTAYFDQTVRASGKTAKISGRAKLSRKTYSDRTSKLKFSRKNKTSLSKRITNSAYQGAANSMLRYAFDHWEQDLESGPTLCFRNFGFRGITVFDSSVYTTEW